MEKKKIDFCIGIFDNLTENGIKKIKDDISKCEIYGIGVYTENVVKESFFTNPINSLEKRMEIAKKIEGVKFVFPLDTNDIEKIKEIVKQEAVKYLTAKK